VAETKRDAFKRLASRRTEAVLERIRILANCANPQLYEYSEGEVEKIFRVINRELRRAKAKFSNSQRAQFEL
jgi:hypothetical protein